jgi:repressor LexA
MTKTDKTDLKGYAFIRGAVINSGVTPSLREIGRGVGYASPRSVQLMLKRLQSRGLLAYSNGVIRLSTKKARSTATETVDVPLVGSVACGLPSLAEQDYEAMVGISTQIARPGNTYFLLRAVGTSMNRSGIKDGDLVLVRQQPTADEGDRIVALINGEATIKHFHRQGHFVILRPNSTDKAHAPIVLSDDLTIQGVVAATLPGNLY